MSTDTKDSASNEQPYVINEPGFSGAVARLVEQFKAQNPSIGKFQATCHDGSVVTIEIEKKKPRKANKRA